MSSIEEVKEKEQKIRNIEKCLKGYCVISLVTSQSQVCTPLQLAITNHGKKSGFQAHWENLVAQASSTKYFGTQLPTVRAIGCEKAVVSHWSLGHFGMSLSSPEQEHWISEHWQLLLNNEGFITWGWTPTNQAPVGVGLCKGNPSASSCCKIFLFHLMQWLY